MLGLEAGRRWRGFNRIKPVQLVRILAPPGVIAHQLVEAGIGRAGKEIRVERNNHIRVGQVVLLGSAILKRRAGNRRIVLHKLCLRPRCLRSLPLPGQRGRSDGRAQEINAASILTLSQLLAQRLGKLGPLAVFAAIHHMLRAVRIVEIEQRALRKRIGRTVVIRVLRIAIDLDGAELIALD